MPNQQPRLSEHISCGTSCKNAKDKSNNTTLLAIRNSEDADDSSGRGSRCSSEKDSGYSDGSEWHHTDAEDRQSNKNQSRASEHAQASQSGQRNPGSVPGIPAGHDHPPLYIFKDMVLKQPSVIQSTGQLLWRNNIGESGFSATPHVILFQQPGLVPDSLQLHKPSSQRPNTSGKKANGSYIPILNSYPRIAPHPSKKPPDKSSLNPEPQSLSKRAPISRGHHKDSTTSSRHRRFLNTVEILRQSGLLDITLRTKELLRQSTATDRGIAQLRQHADLLCQAANDPSGVAGWKHVHSVMDESGCYPGLKAAQKLQSPSDPESANQPQSNANGPPAAETPKPSLSPTHGSARWSASEQDRKLKVSEKCPDAVTIMPPDSSTG
ncbi:unnamed protein product [Ophioblennius macclurei]